ncbi:MAG: hypothetical protein ACRENE_16175 [Polyangiaceae bacterium]
MAPVPLAPRGDRPAPLVFKQGAHAPYAIRWYGATSLLGHFRNLIATAIASESVDSRDWMRPLDADEMCAAVTEVLGVENRGNLLASLGRPLWIDWVADTGDDHDVSQAVGRMLFHEYVVDDGGQPLVLPRGDVLLFGGDTAYPVATADEIHQRVLRPWNEVLRSLDDPDPRPRVLLGIPGNHDWYDGLDGFGRFFRRGADSSELAPDSMRPEPSMPPPRGRGFGLVVRQLHLDELGGIVKMVRGAIRSLRAFWRGKSLARRRRLTLVGYRPVQEASFWALPLVEGLDLWGVDRQLGRLDYRQRGYFRARRAVRGEALRICFAAPDPALAYGEPWEHGQAMLSACNLSLARDPVLYLCGDLHQYERRQSGRGMHVIAGGGGAFLHGNRIMADPSPAAAAYPDARESRRLAFQVPLKLMLGRAGYLVHMGAALVAFLELGIGWHSRARLIGASVAATVAFIWMLYTIAGHQRAHPGRVLALAVPFGTILGLLPFGLTRLFHPFAKVIPLVGRDTAVLVVYAFVAALVFGIFLAICALRGFEMQQAFTVLGHPGFKHFVRLRVSPDGTVDAWVIGKDDPLASPGPWLVDRWTWT